MILQPAVVVPLPNASRCPHITPSRRQPNFCHHAAFNRASPYASYRVENTGKRVSSASRSPGIKLTLSLSVSFIASSCRVALSLSSALVPSIASVDACSIDPPVPSKGTSSSVANCEVSENEISSSFLAGSRSTRCRNSMVSWS